MTSFQRWLIGWFGVRGIGSLYYLAYAFGHGFPRDHARALGNLTISVVALSIVLHGITATPLLSWYARKLARSAASA